MTTTEEHQHSQTEHQSGTPGYDLLNYRLQTQIAQEELATAYIASHLTLNRPVQVHILRRTDWISISRFHLAARLAARISHPNLQPVIDAGHDDQFGDYMVTPLIEARILSDMLREGVPLEPIFILRVASQLSEVLDFLHAQHVIHRDVQPANILVTDEGTTYLSNLSLAASPDTPDLSSIDEADYLTPYSAPEQRLDPGEASPALDIYSLGAVLYHMFSGDIPPPPGTHLPSLAAQDTSLREVDDVLQRMMVVHPESRFHTATDAAGALRRALHVHIDRSTEDMEEGHWEPVAEWLENPLERVLGDVLNQEYTNRSHARADMLHRSEYLCRVLNRWSRKGQFRRPALGHVIQLERVVSYNIYFYELRTLYESRVPLPPRRVPQRGEERSTVFPLPHLWDITVPESPPFTEVPAQELVWPNSRRVIACPDCSGTGKVRCKTCDGQGELEKQRKVRPPEGPQQIETYREVCPTCRGYRQQQCATCEGFCNLVEEQVFEWARRAYLWKNTDSMEGLPKLALQQREEPVYSASINLYDDRWLSVVPLSELLRESVASAGNESRILAAELHVHGVPVTEVEYRFDDTSSVKRLFLVGFDNEVVGTWSLMNMERLALVAVMVVLALVIVVVVLTLV